MVTTISEKLCNTLSKICFHLPIPRPETPETPEKYCEEEVNTAQQFSKVCSQYINFGNKCVLDLGCGLGGQTVYFGSQGCATIVGLDIGKRGLLHGVAYARKNGVYVVFIQGDGVRLPFRDGEFEIVVMFHVIEHIPNVFKLMKECKRVLKGNGLLYVVFPSWRYPYAAHIWGSIPIPWCHVFFSETTLLKILLKLKPEPSTHTINQFLNLSRITIKQFRKIAKNLDFKTVWHQEKPPIKLLSLLEFSPLILREFFISNAIYVMKKIK